MGSSNKDWLKSNVFSNLEDDCCSLIFLAQHTASCCTPTCKRPCLICLHCSKRRDFSRWRVSGDPFLPLDPSPHPQHSTFNCGSTPSSYTCTITADPPHPNPPLPISIS